MKDTQLRRRTRDSGWQWMMIGIILGLGFAMIVCGTGYMLEILDFPGLKGDEPTKTGDGPEVVIKDNSTEVAFNATASQQALNDTLEAGTTQEAETPAVPTPTPSLLPDNTTAITPTQGGVPAATTPAPGALAATITPAGNAAQQVSSLPENTAVVGTPLVGTPSPEIPVMSPTLDIPDAVEAIMSPMISVPGGTYLMGTTTEEGLQAVGDCDLYDPTTPCEDSWVSDSVPPHPVLVDSFQMELYEVSLEQYVAFLNWKGPNSHRTGCEGQPCALTTTENENSYISFDGTAYSIQNPDVVRYPVTFVTWYGAKEYCETLNRRLPTEAEWERAARGPQNFTYPWGFTFETTRANSSRPEKIGTVAVDSYPTGRSSDGIYNLAGNVEEWVSDWYQQDYYTELARLNGNTATDNPQGPTSGTQKVLRGGAWDQLPIFLRSMHRRYLSLSETYGNTGFRCAADVSLKAPVVPAANNSGTTNNSAPAGGGPTVPAMPTQMPTNTPAGPTATIAPG
jgi:formylglycine-generating enzyme required for sulfatase activity